MTSASTGELAAIARDLEVLAERVKALDQALATAAPEPLDAPPKLLSAGQVAEQLGMAKARIYALAREARIGDVIRIGSQIRFDPRGLDEWLRAGGLASSGEPTPIPLARTRPAAR